MNLSSDATWKGPTLRIGEAEPDFHKRYGTSHYYIPLPIDHFILAPIGPNAGTGHLQAADQPENVVWYEGFKAPAFQTCPLSLLKTSLHGLVGTLLLWVGSFL